MNTVPRHIIEDLIPAYLADDVSKETRQLIESYAEQDSEIKRLIEESETEQVLFNEALEPADEVEFEAISRVKHWVRKTMVKVAAATVAILLVPLTAMNFTSEVNWDLLDFIVMAIMLLGSGLAYVFIANLSQSGAYKLATAIAVLTGFMLIWGNLAVGFIGSESNPANLLYLLVFVVVGWQLWRHKMTTQNLAKAMLIGAITLFLVPFIALTMIRPELLIADSLAPTLIINTFLSLFLASSGLLYRKALDKQQRQLVDAE